MDDCRTTLPGKVGIALAAFDPELEYFAQQLQSIQNQTYPHWICIITLDSPLVPLQRAPILSQFFADPRFIWREDPVRLGHKKNFERAIQLCAQQSVDMIGCSDQDDVWFPEKLALSVQALDRAGPLSLVHTNMHLLLNGSRAPLTVWEMERRGVHHADPGDLLVRNIVAGCSMLFDAELARRFKTIPDEADYHDHWYALVASYYGGVHPIHQPLFDYRQHTGNVVGATPYAGFFHLPSGTNSVKLFEKFRNCWRKSHRLARAVERYRLPMTSLQKIQFLSRFDFGISLVIRGIGSLASDPALARATIARGVGKLVAFF